MVLAASATTSRSASSHLSPGYMFGISSLPLDTMGCSIAAGRGTRAGVGAGAGQAPGADTGPGPLVDPSPASTSPARQQQACAPALGIQCWGVRDSLCASQAQHLFSDTSFQRAPDSIGLSAPGRTDTLRQQRPVSKVRIAFAGRGHSCIYIL